MRPGDERERIASVGPLQWGVLPGQVTLPAIR